MSDPATNYTSDKTENKDIDESLYSRQLHTFGAEAQLALSKASVLISGLSGLGVEIAKCVIMTGVKSVTLHDTQNVSVLDLSSNYYATLEDIGKPRTDVVRSKLAELNSNVNVVTNNEPLSESHAKRHDVIVICDSMAHDNFAYNELARQYGTKFIMGNTFGLFGNVFCDFGNEFVVNDADGETPSSGALIQSKDECFITNEPHGLYVGDIVNIKLENDEYTDEVVKIVNAVTFKLKKGGLQHNSMLKECTFTQQKQPVTHNFKSLVESFANPEFSMVMVEDFDRQRLLHDFYNQLGIFVKSNKRLPMYWNDDDMNEILQKVKCENETQTNVIKKLCWTTMGKVIEVDSIVAPIVAQEVMKAASKKYTPTKQWLYIDRTDLISNEKLPDEEVNFLPDRYLGRNIVYGKSLQQKVIDSKVFVVGAGAIGCEDLKNLGMMGVGNIIVTDMDTIEKSNLSRQFFFRNKDIGKPKSECAAAAVMTMNPYVKVVSQQNKICTDTLSLYNEKFFADLNAVLTALDNKDARLFVDKLCLQHSKYLIDAGTLGTKGNVQVVVPGLTESYGQSRDPPEKDIPMCTLKNFPYLIEHCIQWARDMFEGLFTKAVQDFIQYKENPEKFRTLTESDRNQLTEVSHNVNFVRENVACHMKECIQLAYKLWHEHFRDQIYHLTKKFPENCVTSEQQPFWAGTKKFPKFSEMTGTEMDIAFIESVANLWAEVCCLNERVTEKQIIQFLKKSTPPPISGASGAIGEDEKQQKEMEAELISGKSIEELINSLPDVDEIREIKVVPLEFEKDDPTNFHIDFVTSTSNLRATNYGIPLADKFKTKVIAGKIIPAIVTTTSLVSGLAMCEFMKTLQGFNKVEQYANSFVNLALPVLAFSDPIQVAKISVGKFEYTQWDKITFNDMTIKQLIDTALDMVEDETLKIASISSGPFQLFSVNHSNNLIKKRHAMKISDIFTDLTKEMPGQYIPIEIAFDKEDENEDDVIEDLNEGINSIECRIAVQQLVAMA